MVDVFIYVGKQLKNILHSLRELNAILNEVKLVEDKDSAILSLNSNIAKEFRIMVNSITYGSYKIFFNEIVNSSRPRKI